ncbi:2-hydroxyacid dehydrogenase [Brevibacillus sp. TJ4]|uniref:2-hydroxyacid dehydrogenase n=1 Tax=Brevibacillus sp. TJ4 TaxID=3234853 RepID=UPI0037D97FA2
MRPKVIVYKKVEPAIAAYLRQWCDVVLFDALDERTLPDFYRELEDAEGLLGSGLRIDNELLDRAPRLKIVSNISVGYDNLDIPAMSSRGVMATNTPDVLSDTVADLMIGLMLAVARRIPELDLYVKAGEWKSPAAPGLFGVDVHHKTLGIIGMGRIGAAIAKRAYHGFDMNILYHNRSRNADAERLYQASYTSLEELCRNADFICLMAPLTPDTVNLIGEKEFRLMKQTAIFVNGSRGATVDEAALVRALREGEIRGAGLDVFQTEPLGEKHPFQNMANVVTVPHIGSATAETRMKMAEYAAENLVLGLQGKVPPALLNRE